jgi:RNA polymerase sigma-70 factor, ECF subfamily
MRQALAGHEPSYRQVLDEITRAMRGVVRGALSRAGRGNADAEDIVQEILLAIHVKRETWDQAQPLAPWVNAITRYKLIDCLRRQGIRVAVPIDAVSETLAVVVEDTSSDTGDVRKLLVHLAERDRRIVEDISLEGRSIGETARSLGMQEGAVRVALHRAIKKLAALYRRENPEV